MVSTFLKMSFGIIYVDEVKNNLATLKKTGK